MKKRAVVTIELSEGQLREIEAAAYALRRGITWPLAHELASKLEEAAAKLRSPRSPRRPWKVNSREER